MKNKLLFITLTVFAVFSCSKEEVVVENEPQPFKYMFNVAEKPSFDADTKAVKSSWKNGDKIYIVFDDQLPTSLSDFTILEYSSDGWAVQQETVKPPKTDSGTLDALYYEGTELNPYLDDGEFFINALLDDFSKFMYLNSNNIPYTIKDGVLKSSLSLDFDSDSERTYVQFCITDLIGDDWSFYREDILASDNSFNLWAPTWKNDTFGHYSISNASFDYPLDVREDGHYIYLSVLQNTDKITITLVKTNGNNAGKYQKTFSKKISGKRAAITFKGPQFNNSGECLNGWEKLNEQENNVIYYSSTDGKVVTPLVTTGFGANLVNNEYTDGQGIMTFDGDITSIPQDAFRSRSTLKSFIMPNSVTSIGWTAFIDCTKLESISLSDNIISLDVGAFQGCGLKSIELPDGIKGIPKYAFNKCTSLESITFPSNLLYIDEEAFSHCTSLVSVSMPESVVWIGSKVFYYNTSLKTVVLSKDLTSIPYYGFRECFSLQTVSGGENVTLIDSYAFYKCSNLREITQFKSLERISSDAFANCSSLTSFSFPNTLKSINYRAFQDCSNLEAAILGDNVEDIWGSAFEGCSSLKQVSFGDKLISIGQWAFRNCTGLQGDVIIPQTTTTIETEAFINCSSLNRVVINGPLSDVGDNTFANCVALENVEIAEGTLYITKGMFTGCTSLKTVNIPNSVKHINESAFWDCSSLTEITIPENVTYFGDSIFGGCSSLCSIKGKGASSDNRCLIIDGVLFGFAPFGISSYTLPDDVVSISSWVFYKAGGLKDLTIDNNCTSIARAAFFECTGLSRVYLPESITTMGEEVFYHDTSLEEITFPSGLTAIPGAVCQGCSNLKTVSFSADVTSLGYYAFKDCIKMESMYCRPINPPSLGNNVFSGINGAVNIYVPSSSLSTYQSDSGWRVMIGNLVGYNY